jgi:hypothetical protein
MLYKFRSPASGDVIMLGPHGDWMLRLLGREPAARGIIEPADMPQALQALHRAVDQDDQTKAVAASADTQDPTPGVDEISARQRLWPMMDMLHRALQAGEPVVWGV